MFDSYYMHASGHVYPVKVSADDVRVVVISPEDREQVERLIKELRSRGLAFCNAHDVAAALREFANPKPPKPEEPTGLGAVVEDSDGERYILTNPSGVAKWIPVDAGARTFSHPYREYRHIDAVRILSEGVQP